MRTLRSNEVALVVRPENAPSFYECSHPSKILRPASPEIPKSAGQPHSSRAVSIEVVLDSGGSVAAARVTRSSGDVELDSAVLAAARATTYEAWSGDRMPLFLDRFGF